MGKEKKVYDFNLNKTKTKLVTAIKKRKNESTVADLIASTGLPKYQVEQSIKHIADEYSGHLKVTQSGEILYYFPQGMRSRFHGFVPSLKRFTSRFLNILNKILTFLFKIWIMIMLVGYFVIFLVILIAAVVALTALSASGKGKSSSRSRGRGGSFGGFYLVMKLIELFIRVFFWVNLTKASKASGKRGKPLYKSVFVYIFGDEDPNRNWETDEKLNVISHIRRNRGVIIIEELMIITGKTFDDAQQLINSYLLEFEGEPDVTENGTIVFFFPELLRTKSGTLNESSSIPVPEYKQLIPFNTNAKKTNAWITFFNTFNIAFSSYFLLCSFVYINEGFNFIYEFLFEFLRYNLYMDPSNLILISLGIIPAAFSLFFFLIPIIRNIRLKKRNEQIKQENLRKQIYSTILLNTENMDKNKVNFKNESDTPKKSLLFIEKQIDLYAGQKNADVEARDDGSTFYKFTELRQELDDLKLYREKINLKDYDVGDTVFDSGE